METKEMNTKEYKPFIIANPMYDTVFKRMMENMRIVKFFLSTILEQQVEDIIVMPQEFTYRLNQTVLDEIESKSKDKKKGRGKKGGPDYYLIFRLDFMATIRDADGSPRKILIELQKSWDTLDVVRFRRYLGEQYVRVDYVDGKKVTLPITTIYILGNNVAEIGCPCLKVGREQIDMLNQQTVYTKSKFVENVTHECYIIQAGRIPDVRYATNLDKLLSIFEQRHFIVNGSDVRKEYPYQPDDENIKLITDVLYEMGADPQKRKEIEDEAEALRVYNLQHGSMIKTIEEQSKENAENKKIIEEQSKELKEDKKIIEEKDKKLEEKDKELEEDKKIIEEKDKKLEEKDKTIEEQGKENVENKKIIEEKDKELEELKEKMAEMERFFRNKRVE